HSLLDHLHSQSNRSSPSSDMTTLSLFFCIFLLHSTAITTPINYNDVSGYGNYDEDVKDDFVEKDSCKIFVRIDAPPSIFFSLLPNYLKEVSLAINRSTIVEIIDDHEQIFVGVNESRRIITEKDSSLSDANFVEVTLETDLLECFSVDRLINSISQARHTFSSVSVFGSLISDPHTSSSHQSSSGKLFIGLGCCISIIMIVVIVVIQKRRSPKKRTHIESAETATPNYDDMPNAIPLELLDESPEVKRIRLSTIPPPPIFPTPHPPITQTHQSSTVLHDLASGAGPINITDDNRWMVNIRDENGFTPLHCLAVAPFDKKCPTQTEREARTLIENGANVNERDNGGNTPLHLSVASLRLSLSQILLNEEEIDVTIVNNNEQTLLHIAASVNDFLVLDLLLAAPNAKKTLNMTEFHNYTPLAVNVRNSCSDVNFIRKLLVAGADPNYPGDEVFDHNQDYQVNRERTALHYAAQLGLNEHVKVLTEFGANVNAHDSRRRSPLHYAVENLKSSTIQLLISIGADMGIHDHNDQTPIDLARHIGYEEAVAFFEFEIIRRKKPVEKKRKRRGKDDNEKKRRRSSTDTGYKSSSPVRDIDEETAIMETPSRVVQPHPNQLFPQSLPPPPPTFPRQFRPLQPPPPPPPPPHQCSTICLCQ
ncbi:hypothetical protein PRIPAC_71354, partial [Pristionchus pacificus]